MKASFILITFLLALSSANGAPIWKVFCSSRPLFRGRIDPIMYPGQIAGHVHKVSGANHFSAFTANQNSMDVYDNLMNSSCTTCSLNTVDLSVYWHPDLYYSWPNGTFSLVPDGGLTVYYLSRTGSSGTQLTNPNWQPIPKGLRMVAGDHLRRSFNGTLAERAVNYACLTASGVTPPPTEPNNFPTDKYFCANGLRAQVFFPMCWDGVNLDSSDHKSHMAYPDGVNGGNCPSTHPVRIPGVFFEAFYSVDRFPHGNGTNPFVWSMGDSTGYGFHGDFLSGWNTSAMKAAIADPNCDNNNPAMAFGNNVKACPPLAPYVQSTPVGACHLSTPIPLTEDLGIYNAISKLPGCNPVTKGPAPAVACSLQPNQSVSSGIDKRFLLKSVLNNLFVSAPDNMNSPLVANVTIPTYNEIWDVIQFSQGTALINEATGQYVSSSGADRAQLFANRGSPNTWEAYVIVPQPGGKNVVAIKSIRNSMYVSVATNGGLYPISSNISTANLFQLITPDGGSPIWTEARNQRRLESEFIVASGSSTAFVSVFVLLAVAMFFLMF